MSIQIPKRGFYVLKSSSKFFPQCEAAFWSGCVFGPNMYCQKAFSPNTTVLMPFTPWMKASLKQLDFHIMMSDFDFYPTWDSIPKSIGLPLLNVAAPYVHEKGRKLHRSEYFKMYMIQDFLMGKGFDYTKMSDDALLILIKRYKGWVQVGFPKSVLAIIQKVSSENP